MKIQILEFKIQNSKWSVSWSVWKNTFRAAAAKIDNFKSEQYRTSVPNTRVISQQRCNSSTHSFSSLTNCLESNASEQEGKCLTWFYIKVPLLWRPLFTAKALSIETGSPMGPSPLSRLSMLQPCQVDDLRFQAFVDQRTPQTWTKQRNTTKFFKKLHQANVKTLIRKNSF